MSVRTHLNIAGAPYSILRGLGRDSSVEGCVQANNLLHAPSLPDPLHLHIPFFPLTMVEIEV